MISEYILDCFIRASDYFIRISDCSIRVSDCSIRKSDFLLALLLFMIILLRYYILDPFDHLWLVYIVPDLRVFKLFQKFTADEKNL